jgi:hypothetical protein
VCFSLLDSSHPQLFVLLLIGLLVMFYSIEQYRASYWDRFLWLPLVLATAYGTMSGARILFRFLFFLS